MKSKKCLWGILMVILAVAALPRVLCAQESGRVHEQKRYAVAKFDRLSWDFGEVERGSETVAVFEISNQGQAPLVVENVTASCGCTVAKWSKEPLMPQDTLKLKIYYNSNIVGEIKRSVVVKTNDERRQRTLLTLMGNILPDDEEIE